MAAMRPWKCRTGCRPTSARAVSRRSGFLWRWDQRPAGDGRQRVHGRQQQSVQRGAAAPFLRGSSPSPSQIASPRYCNGQPSGRFSTHPPFRPTSSPRGGITGSRETRTTGSPLGSPYSAKSSVRPSLSVMSCSVGLLTPSTTSPTAKSRYQLPASSSRKTSSARSTTRLRCPAFGTMCRLGFGNLEATYLAPAGNSI